MAPSVAPSVIRPTVADRKRNLKPEKIAPYHGKHVKDHLNFMRNLKTAFRMIPEEFTTEDLTEDFIISHYNWFVVQRFLNQFNIII